jgi:hypothetical protein
MEPALLRVGRWIAGGVAFVALAAILFEAVGHSSPRPAPVRANAYRAVSLDDREVRTALSFAIADRQKKSRSQNAATLLNVLSAERQESKGDNFRLCLSLSRRGRPETARTVVHRDQQRQWSVTLWAWGACRNKQK